MDGSAKVENRTIWAMSEEYKTGMCAAERMRRYRARKRKREERDRPPRQHVPRKLDYAKAEEIRRRPEGTKAMAREYGVSVDTIRAIRQGRAWSSDKRGVPGPRGGTVNIQQR